MNGAGPPPSASRAARLWLASEMAAGTVFAFRHRGGMPALLLAVLAALCLAAALILLRLALPILARRYSLPARDLFGRLAIALSPALLLALDLVQERFILRDVSTLLLLLVLGGSAYLLSVTFIKLSRPGSPPAPAAAPGRFPVERKTQRRTLLAVFAAGWLVYSLVLLSGLFPPPPFTGDEPHYLLITASMVRDRDIDLRNNYQDGDYLEFYPGPLRWHALPSRIHPERYYSQHFPALPLLLAPAYWIGDRLGRVLPIPGMNRPGPRNIRVLLARESVVLMAALLAALFFQWVWEFSASRRIALFSWLFFAFTQPLLFYSRLLLTEIPAALIMLLVLRQAVSHERDGRGSFFWSGAGLALLPWFGIKYTIPAAFVLAALIAARWQALRRQPRRFFHLLGPIAVSAGLFTLFLLQHFGSVAFTDVYSGRGRNVLGVIAGQGPLKIASNALAYFLDQRQGLFIHSPLYILLLPGIVIAWSMRRKAAIAALVIAIPYWIMYSLSWSTGGYAPPGRALFPVIPILALFAACGAARAARRAPALLRVLAVLSLLLALLAVFQPLLFYHEGLSRDSWNKDTAAHSLERISNIALDFTRLVPNLVYLPKFSWPVLLAWLAIMAAISLAVLKKKRNGTPPPFRLGGHATCVLMISAFLALHHFFDVRLDDRNRLTVPGGSVFFQDRNSFGPELGGFWIRGNSRCDVVLRTRRPSQRLTLDLSSPVPLRASIICGAPNAGGRFAVSGPTSARVVIPAPRGVPWKGNFLYLVRFEVAGGFRPGKLEPGNPDPRFLGLFVRWPAQ